MERKESSGEKRVRGVVSSLMDVGWGTNGMSAWELERRVWRNQTRDKLGDEQSGAAVHGGDRPRTAAP